MLENAVLANPLLLIRISSAHGIPTCQCEIVEDDQGEKKTRTYYQYEKMPRKASTHLQSPSGAELQCVDCCQVAEDAAPDLVKIHYH